jgi:cell division protein FtsQ
LRRPLARLLAGLVVGLLILGGAYLWVRDSSLVAVQKVRISGVSGPDAAQVQAALRAAAHNMTTLDVKMASLQTAVAPFPVVKSIDVTTQFPHGMSIQVHEQVPVAMVDAGGHRIAAAGDGTLLRDTRPRVLPAITLSVPPGGTHLSGLGLSEARLLGAAPYALLSRISQVADSAQHGLTAEVRSGPSLYFGDGAQLGAKWAAATEVLANSGSAGAAYIDVSDPRRPAAGSGSDTTSSAATSGG